MTIGSNLKAGRIPEGYYNNDVFIIYEGVFDSGGKESWKCSES